MSRRKKHDLSHQREMLIDLAIAVSYGHHVILSDEWIYSVTEARGLPVPQLYDTSGSHEHQALMLIRFLLETAKDMT